MLRLATLFVTACTALAMAAPTPDDDLDGVLRSVDSWDLLKEGVDYEYTDIGIVLQGLTCYTASSLRCIDQDMHCRYVAAGTVCTYCDGTGGMWIASNGICVQDPNGVGCTVNPAGGGKCGKQRRSSCIGVAPNLSCGTVTIPSTRDCDLKECTP